MAKQNFSSHESIIPPRWLLTLVAIALGVWLLVTLKEIVILLVVGYCIAYLIDPLLELLEKRRVSRGLGVIVVFAGFALISVLLVLTALPTLSREYEKLSLNFPTYIDVARTRLEPLYEQLRDRLPLLSQSDNPAQGDEALPFPALSGDTVKGIIATLIRTLLSGYNIVLVVANLALLPFIVYYLAVDFKRLHRGVVRILPVRKRKGFTKLALEIDSYVSAFVRGQLIVGAILACLYMAGLSIIGVDLWVLLALISGFGNLIPYFGFMVGIVLSSVMALVTFGDLSHLIQVLVLYGAVQAIEGTFITPKVVGEKVGLSPLTVILAIFAGGKLFGLLGIFLAIPGAAVLKVLTREIHQNIINRAEIAHD
jgi:predicted PurR-regulated permease PerM